MSLDALQKAASRMLQDERTMGLALAGFGTGFQTAGQYAEAQREKELWDYNAAVMSQQAELIKEATKFEQIKTAKERDKELARIRLLAAASGLSPTGTVVEQLTKSRTGYMQDIAMLGYKGKLATQRALSMARLYKMRGRAARRRGLWGAGTTILTGATQMYKRRPASTSASTRFGWKYGLGGYGRNF